MTIHALRAARVAARGRRLLGIVLVTTAFLIPALPALWILSGNFNPVTGAALDFLGAVRRRR